MLATHATSQTCDRPFAGLAAYVTFLALIEMVTLGYSTLHVAISQGEAIGIWIVAALASRAVYRHYLHASRQDPPDAKAPWHRTFFGLGPLVVLSAAALYLFLWFFAWCCPDFSWDGPAYHIPPIHFWIRVGYISWIDPNIPFASYMNGYPKGMELVAFLLVKATGATALVNSANLLFLPLGALGIRYLARRLGANATLAMLAAFSWILIPSVIAQSPTTYVEAAFGSCIVAAFACLAHAASILWQNRSGIRRAALILGAALGLTLACKSSGPMFLVVVLSALFLVAISSPDLALGWRTRLRRAAINVCLPALGLALLVGGYWYFRNYVLMGSPLYPAGIRILGHVVFPGLDMERTGYFTSNTPAFFRDWPNFVKTLYTWTQVGYPDSPWPRCLGGADGRYGGLGFLWLFGCVPAIGMSLWQRLRRPDQATRYLLLLLAVVLVTFLGTPANWWARYTIWIYALGLPCFAYVMTLAASPVASPSGHLLRFWVAACLIVTLVEAAVSLNYHLATFQGHTWATLVQLRNHRQGPYLFREWNDPTFDQILREPGTVALCVSGITPSGRPPKVSLITELAVPLGRRDILWLPAVNDDTLPYCLSRNVRYVLLDDTIAIPAGLAGAARRITYLPGLTIITLSSEANPP